MEPPVAVTDATFIEAMTRLMLIDLESSLPPVSGVPPPNPDSSRRAALTEIGVSPEELIEFADRLGGDPERMERLWLRIQAVVDSSFAARRVRGGSEARSEAFGKLGMSAGTGGDDSGRATAAPSAPAPRPEALPSELRHKVEALKRARTRRDTTPSP